MALRIAPTVWAASLALALCACQSDPPAAVKPAAAAPLVAPPVAQVPAPTPTPAAPAAAAAQSAADADPFLWLEEVSSPRAMAWVEQHNAASVKVLDADPHYAAFYQTALEVAGDKNRIPEPTFTHGAVYNFWQDPQHLRGIWRKTSLADYQAASPHWTTVLDIDALGKTDGKSWVLKDISCLRPDERRCLISLSDGGEDAVEIREFDLDSGAFVSGGLHLPRGKHRVSWEDMDHLLVASEWTPGELTASGYPFVVKRVTRGQPLEKAAEVFRGAKADGGYGVSPRVLRDNQGRSLAVVTRPLDTFRGEIYVIGAGGAQRLAIPAKSGIVDLVGGRVVVVLNESWTSADGHAYGPGSLVDMDLSALKADPGHLKAQQIWAPGAKESLENVTAAGERLVVTTLSNVRGRVTLFSPKKSAGWTARALPIPDNLAVRLGSAQHNGAKAFITTSGFLTPSSLWLVDTAKATLKMVKSLPAKFDASQDVVEQLEATSSDGVRVPYFVVHRKSIPYDGSTPTLMTAYGGFQVSQTPSYSATNGKLWLERGGAYVLANIRGGGEFGPAWHEAGLLTKRQIVYDDFAAVAKDLIARKITSPRRLGIQGGSNGGLLMGVQFTQHPELWNAVVINVPLLDMIRIGKIAAGASWQGEYGDPESDPKVMEFWRRTSPYHNLKSGVKYPTPYIFTTTKDDRVGPQHARKFAARMEAMGLPFYYYENTEGGHGSGADLKQSARSAALAMTYLQKTLVD